MRSASKRSSILVDLDGTLTRGRTAEPGVADALATFGDAWVIVSNDAEHVPHQLARQLHALGLHIPPERLVLAGAMAIKRIACERPGAQIMLLGSPSLRRYARSLGLDVAGERPEIVVLARDRSFSHARLAVAANALGSGAELIVTNPDRTHPHADASIVPDTGALLAALLACTGPIRYRMIGKPEPMLYLAALALLDVRAEDSIMIGDNDETDGLGAERLGIPYIHVRPGEVADVLRSLHTSDPQPNGYRRRHEAPCEKTWPGA